MSLLLMVKGCPSHLDKNIYFFIDAVDPAEQKLRNGPTFTGNDHPATQDTFSTRKD